MSESTSFTAEILETSASAYAGCAAHLFLEQNPEIADESSRGDLRTWKSHLTHRVLELSAAVGAEEPAIFAARLQWAGKAFDARDMKTRDLRSSLACLREVLAEELPEIARETATSYIDSALDAFDQPPSKPAMGSGLDPANPTDRLALQYLQAALEGDSPHAVDIVIAATEDSLSVQDAYLKILLPAQQEVGRLWHTGDLRIAEEHLVTTTTERVMSILAYRSTALAAAGSVALPSTAHGKTVLSATVAGNTHHLAVRVLADFFEMAGWRSICLGANVPPSDLATAVVYFDADLLMLSAALSTQIKMARQTIEEVRQLPDRTTKILVGGSGFNDAPELWQRIGADGHALTADSAVTLGAQLVGLGSSDP